jgi:CHAT domain-containing protein/tetratricopeptide (TPR) repeat protein
MKLTIVFSITLVFVASLNFSYAQSNRKEIKLANNYKKLADDYNFNRKRDSSVIFYTKALELYTNVLDNSKNPTVLKNYIHCRSNLAYDLAHSGFSTEAFDIAIETLKLYEKEYRDTNELLARVYLSIAYCYDMQQDFENAINYYSRALEIYESLNQTENIYLVRIYSNIAIVYYYHGLYDLGIQYLNHSLNILSSISDKENSTTAALYNVLGVFYDAKGDLEKSLKYNLNALSIFIRIAGEESKDVGDVCLNIGALYEHKLMYDSSLYYYNRALSIYINPIKENKDVANVYNNIGNIQKHLEHYQSALEYYQYARDIYLSVFGETNLNLAMCYNNLGVVYEITNTFDKALENYNKSLRIKREILGDDNQEVAVIYGNLGVLYTQIEKYDLALEFLTKSLQIYERTMGSNHISCSGQIFNIARVYKLTGEVNKSIDFYNRALTIKINYYGTKHKEIALVHSNIGVAHYDNQDLEKSIRCFQNGLISLCNSFQDTCIYSQPNIKDVKDKRTLWLILQNKIKILSDYNTDRSLKAALDHTYACDTIINSLKIEASNQIDKLNLSKKALELYLIAYDLCVCMIDRSSYIEEKREYENQALYFLEKNKATILYEALANTEAKKFAQLPDSLLEKENNLKSQLAFYHLQISQETDSTKKLELRRNIFVLKESINKLIELFETNYPKYFDLKYNAITISLLEIQNLLDYNTAIISYITIDSIISIVTISKDSVNINYVTLNNSLKETITEFRNGLIYPNSKRFAEMYKVHAVELYKKLIPSNIDSRINNLVIIPEAELSLIPFETLLTDEVTDKNWSELPYLINKYSISYSYSINLFFKTYNKIYDLDLKITKLNDWLALAPVFDNDNTAGLTLRTRNLIQSIDSTALDTLVTRGRLSDGHNISSLPGTESEVQSIFKEFEKKKKSAMVQLKDSANEDFIKNGGLKNYKYLHFATHGFVNTENPEMSGILLAQDSTLNEDGILYSAEVYSLDLNADLTILSACETGLGKIEKGEGLIGLTRALLYAGSKNIIVSFWKVSDVSTSKLMIDFYKLMLEEQSDEQSFSKYLQQAKLKMIKENTFSHPFYWSPFILIGR